MGWFPATRDAIFERPAIRRHRDCRAYAGPGDRSHIGGLQPYSRVLLTPRLTANPIADPVRFRVPGLLFAALALLACRVPVRRAAVDPIEALLRE